MSDLYVREMLVAQAVTHLLRGDNPECAMEIRRQCALMERYLPTAGRSTVEEAVERFRGLRIEVGNRLPHPHESRGRADPYIQLAQIAVCGFIEKAEAYLTAR